jgi:N-acetylmuramoyl-L-alanine amidase
MYALLRNFIIFMLFYCILYIPGVNVSAAEDPLTEKLLRFDVIIDVGHGGIDGGTSAGNILEKDLNLQISSRLYSELQKRGFQVGITRLHDYALSDDSPFQTIRSRHKRDLIQRKMIANELKPKVFLSIHMNHSPLRYVHGPLIIYQQRAESFLLAQQLQDSLNQTAQTNKSSYPSQRYYLLQTVQSPTMIAEVGYLSHRIEREKLVQPDYQQRIAVSIANAIEAYFFLYPV